MDAKDKRLLETELMKMGLAGLEESGAASGELVQQIAAMINSWQGAPNRHGEWIDKHKFLRDLLGECDQQARQAMYDAITPHLKFKVKPLSHYETMIAERMGNLISKRAARAEGEAPKPVEVGGNKYAAAPKPVATHVIVTVSCFNCPKDERFVGETAVSAMIAVRKAGWVRDKALNKETCPECAAEFAQEEIVVLARNQNLVVNDRRRVN